MWARAPTYRPGVRLLTFASPYPSLTMVSCITILTPILNKLSMCIVISYSFTYVHNILHNMCVLVFFKLDLGNVKHA